MRIDGAGRDDFAFARDYFSGSADDKVRVHGILRAGIAGFSDFDDAAIADSDVGFDDAPVIDNEGVRDDQIKRAVLRFADRSGALPHAVANYFASAESDFVAIDGVIALYFDD